MSRSVLGSIGVTALVALLACQGDRVSPPGHTPVVELGDNLASRVGDTVVLTITASDTRGNGPWRLQLEWGDGASSTDTIAAVGAPRAMTHVYGQPGRFQVHAAIRDDAGAAGNDSTMVVVDSAIVLVGAGDIGECGLPYAARTASILDTTPGTVFTLGDNAYPNGSAQDFASCYDPYWGRHKARTRPTAGNHEYNTPAASGYFGYFGAAAGDPSTGYYSYEAGDWHVVVLNSNLPVSSGSPQERWLRADLQAHPARCTLAMWHYALFSSGTNHASGAPTAALWDALYDAGADVVLVGHEHNYERFAPQTSSGAADARGIREFVAGMGGGGSYSLGPPIANSEARSGEHGLLKLTLRRSSYEWTFVPVTPGAFADSGTASCH